MSRQWITMTGSAPQARLTMTATQNAAAPLPRPAAGDTDSVTASAAIMVDLPATAILAPRDPAGGCRPSSGTRQNRQF